MDAPLQLPPPSQPTPEHTNRFRWLVVSIICIIIALLIFQLGVFVGFHKAGYSFEWGENYHIEFGGPRHGIFDDFVGKDFINGHGTAGSIAQIDGNDIIIMGNDGVEKTIHVLPSTSIRNGNETLKISDLKTEETIVIIGAPQPDGSVNAEIIRIFDPNNMPDQSSNMPFNLFYKSN